MAVEASHREMIYQGDASRYDERLRFQSAYGNKTEEIIPMYGFGMTDSFPANVFKAEGGVTWRKRLRDSSSFNLPLSLPIAHQNQQQFGAFEFLNDDITSHIYQQQLEIDHFISHHTKKVRIHLEEMQRRHSMRITSAYELITNRLKTKEDEIQKIVQLNKSLEEKVKSITIENQIWRELAQTNEATANTLRNNLHQVLSDIHLQQQQGTGFTDNGNDAQSHSGSNFFEQCCDDGEGERKVNDKSEYRKSGASNRWCRKCGTEESCVLLLPCRHLCVCNLCVSSVNICPVCKAIKSAGVHVNMS